MEKPVPLAYRLPALVFPLLFFVPALPPFVDYPQHVAIGAVLRRLADPTSFASQQYVANLFTYNGLFDELVALLSPPLPVEFAARLIVVVALELFVVGTFALFRRQRTHAIAHLLLVPLLPSFALFWGFTNHLLGLGLGVVLVASLVAVVADDDRRAWPNLRVAAVALVLAHTHVLATLIALLIAASWVLDEAMRSSVTWPNRFRRVTHAALLVAPACAFCMAVHLRQFASHAHTYVLATEAETDTLVTKLQWFGLRVTGALRSHQDAHLVWAALLTAVVVAWFARGSRSSRSKAATLPFIVLMSAYLAVPSAFVGTYLVYPRLALPVAMLALSLVPDSRRALPRVLTGIGALVALCTFVVTGSALWRFDATARDFLAVMNAVPATAHVTAVHAATTTDDYKLPVLQHLAAYQVAFHDTHAAGIFGGYASLPVRFRRDDIAPMNTWLEGDGDRFSPADPYAKLFPVRVVVLAHEGDPLPVWATSNHRVLARRGCFVAVQEETVKGS
jgi:hypothetical protein